MTWTAERVETEMIAAFRHMQGRAIYSPVANAFRVDGQPGLDLIALTASVLGRESFDRIALLTWARAKAGGPSVRMICDEKGWARTTFDSARRRGARAVAGVIGATPGVGGGA